jgi:hypothetical protein
VRPAEEAFAEYRKTGPTFDVKPAFVDGWRMGREATLREVLRELRAIYAADPFAVTQKAEKAVRALLDPDA